MRQLAEIARPDVRWGLHLNLTLVSWTEEAVLLDERDWTEEERSDEIGQGRPPSGARAG